MRAERAVMARAPWRCIGGFGRRAHFKALRRPRMSSGPRLGGDPDLQQRRGPGRMPCWREQFADGQPIEVIVVEDGCRDATRRLLDERSASPWGRQ